MKTLTPTQIDKANEALRVTLNSDAGKGLTLREYFYTLISKLWAEGESFDGKRPFGNSAWQYDVYTALIKAGLIEGKLDEDGYIEKLDTKKASKFVERMILVMCLPTDNLLPL